MLSDEKLLLELIQRKTSERYQKAAAIDQTAGCNRLTDRNPPFGHLCSLIFKGEKPLLILIQNKW